MLASATAVVPLPCVHQWPALAVLCNVCCLPAGLQQLQLDVCYMRPRLLQLVGGADAEPVAQLLDDVVAAAAERSTDPTLMDGAALEKAMAAAAAGGNQPGA